MVFNATFSNISVISLMSVLMVEETDVPGENHHSHHFLQAQEIYIIYFKNVGSYSLCIPLSICITIITTEAKTICFTLLGW
jgi:hypothetical protein